MKVRNGINSITFRDKNNVGIIGSSNLKRARVELSKKFDNFKFNENPISFE